MRIKRRSGIVACAVAAALTLAACGQSSGGGESGASDPPELKSLIAKAKDEGSLTVYSSESPEQVKASAQAFEERYGIHVNATRLVTGDLESRYAAERQSGKTAADVISISDTPFFADHADWWMALDEKSIPTIAKFPKNGIGPDRRCATILITPNVIAWNTDRISPKDAPKSYHDLLSPRFSKPGTIVYADPRDTASGMSLFWVLDHKLGDNYFKRLKNQHVDIAPGAAPGTQLLASGANSVMIGTFTNHVQDAVKAGAPIKFIYPEVATGSNNQMGISAKAPHPAAAKLWMAWSMSADGAKTLCAVGGSSVLVGDFKGCTKRPSAHFIDPNYKAFNDTAWIRTHLPLLGLTPKR